MWKLMHRIEYSEIEEARVKLTNPSCKICGETDIQRVHLHFECGNGLEIGNKLLKILRVYDPQYSYTETLEFKGKEEHPQLFYPLYKHSKAHCVVVVAWEFKSKF